MDTNRAAELLDAERRRVEALLKETRDGAASDASQAREAGDYADPAQPLTDEGLQLALAEELEARLDAIASGGEAARRHLWAVRAQRGDDPRRTPRG